MKKLTLLVSLLLCLAMMFTFVSCGSDKGEETTGTDVTPTPKTAEELIIGEWECELDMGEYMATVMGGTTGGDYFEDLEFAINLIMDFDNDGNVEMAIDEDALEGSVDDLKKGLKKGMKVMLEDMAEMYGSSIEEMIAAEGYTDLDKYLDDALADMDVKTLLEGFDTSDMSGTYKIDGDKLYITQEDDEEEDKDDYMLFEVDEDTLELDMNEKDREEAENDETVAIFVEFLPLKFERK